MVEATGQSSKQIDLLRALAARLPDLPLDAEPLPTPPARQLQRRLTDSKIAELAKRYQAGETVATLAGLPQMMSTRAS